MQFTKLAAAIGCASLVLALAICGQTAASPRQGESKAGQREPGLYMTFQTDKGNIGCKLFEKESPITVGKMVGLAIGKISYIDPRTGKENRNKFFDGLTFHRVIPGFMIQGGDPLGNGTGGPKGPGFPYQNENTPGLAFNTPGRLAMANAGPNTNSSQFFITEAPYPSLNGGYTIWGQCQNLDVVKAIARVQRDSNDKPITPVHIQHVIVERVGPAPANAPEAMSTPAAK
ncbi:MAG TPA: peptidylprolyl isomerase [Bryobacteraceae bacterium]|nr:peptidylprolyl isomerase [Bryobacteraceae bacterium]